MRRIAADRAPNGMLESAAMADSLHTAEPSIAPGAYEPFVPASASLAEFTVKAVVLGAMIGWQVVKVMSQRVFEWVVFAFAVVAALRLVAG